MSHAFDPFTATLDEARAQPDANETATWSGALAPGAVRRWEAAQAITAQRTYLEANPIDGVAQCVSEGLVAPHWLSKSFLQQYEKVSRGEVATWDVALGAALPKGMHLSTRRLQAGHGYECRLLFSGPYALPRTPAGRHRAAELLGITERQVRTLIRVELGKTRTNRKGHKSYYGRKPPAGIRANDPFSLAGVTGPQI